ncbi:MAG: prolipoprotein diacylglyceryl transferase [Patescibacteria group bacterium]
MVFLHTVHPPLAAFSIGPLSVHWYGIILALAVSAGFVLSYRLFRQRGVDTAHLANLFIVIFLCGIIGGRMGHLVGEWGYYHDHLSATVQLWRGGIAIHGVLAGALLGLWGYCRWRKLAFWVTADLLVVSLPLMQAIGRWGNYFNQELYGMPTSLPWGIPVDQAFREPGYAAAQYYHPLFLYESLLMLAVFAGIWWLFRRAQLKSGQLTLAYFAMFAVVRFSLDYIRLHKPMAAGLSYTQWLSIGIFIAAALLWWFRYRHRPAENNPPAV